MVNILESMGPELLTQPQVQGKLGSGFLSVSGAGTSSIGILSDREPDKMSQEGLKNYMGHFPAGASFKQVNHFRQLVSSKNFQLYDYGPEKNQEVYQGQTYPPLISLETFSEVPIALFCGQNDLLASPEDYKGLYKVLKKNKNVIYFKEYFYGHLQFLVPQNRRLFYDIISLWQQIVDPEGVHKIGAENFEKESEEIRMESSAKFETHAIIASFK